MSKRYVKILGQEYYDTLNAYVQKKYNVNIEDLNMQHQTSWLTEICRFLKDNYNLGICFTNTGPAQIFCHGAQINKKRMMVYRTNVDKHVRTDIPNGFRTSLNPQYIVKYVDVADVELEFDQWLTTTRAALNTYGVQTELAFE